MNFVFVLFAIAFVSGVQSASISNELEKVHASISQSVEKAVAEFKKVVDQAKDKANELRKKVTDKAKQVYDETSKQVNKILSEIDNQLRDLWKRAGKLDISECKAAKETFVSLIRDSLVNMGKCFDSTIQTGSEIVNKIVDVSKNSSISASQYSEEARKCFKKSEEGAPPQTVVECLTSMATKVKETASTSVSIVSDSMSQLTSLLTDPANDNLVSIPKCVGDKTLEAMFDSSDLLIKETKSCLMRNIDRLKPSQQQW